MVVVGKRPVRYAITDLAGSGLDTPTARRTHLRELVQRWASDRIDFIQLREKQLASGDLLALTQIAMAAVREGAHTAGCARETRLLLNGRPDIAAAAGADGVHLTAQPGELTPAEVRRVFSAAHLATCLVSVSCHSVPEVIAARDACADLILFGPVFEKSVRGEILHNGLGLRELRDACNVAGPVHVLALGGVHRANLAACMAVGAVGYAGIRSFDRVGNHAEQWRPAVPFCPPS